MGKCGLRNLCRGSPKNTSQMAFAVRKAEAFQLHMSDDGVWFWNVFDFQCSLIETS